MDHVKELTGRRGGDIILLMNGANSSCIIGVLTRCLKSPPWRTVAFLRHRESVLYISSLLRVNCIFYISRSQIVMPLYTKLDSHPSQPDFAQPCLRLVLGIRGKRAPEYREDMDLTQNRHQNTWQMRKHQRWPATHLLVHAWKG